MESESTLQLFIPLSVPVLLALAGWWVIVKNSVRVAKRTEIRAICDEIAKKSTELHDDACKIWTDTTTALSFDQENELTYKVSHLEAMSNILKKHYFKLPLRDEFFSELRPLVTPVSNKACTHPSSRRNDINEFCKELSSEATQACYQYINQPWNWIEDIYRCNKTTYIAALITAGTALHAAWELAEFITTLL